MSDYNHLKKILDQYNKLLSKGYSTLSASTIISKNDHDGFESDNDGKIIVLYKGDYILLFGQSNKIFKQVRNE